MEIDVKFIRGTHPFNFRPGVWAKLLGKELVRGRACYHVEFPDGMTDHWVVNDPSERYEFTDKDPAQDTTTHSYLPQG